MKKFIIRLPFLGAILAVVASISLFFVDIFYTHLNNLSALLEAVSLNLIGLSFMFLCFGACRGLDRYHWRMMMGITFCLWGIESILPIGLFRSIVKDLVILLFIIDLFLMMLDNSPISLGTEKIQWRIIYKRKK